MGVRIFLDANVLLDFTLKREAYEDAKRVIDTVIKNKAKAFITSSVLHIAGYWTAKYRGPAEAKKLLIILMADIKIIDIPHEIALVALNSKIDDIEDALQYYAAIHHKLDYFISRDKQLQKNSIPILPILSPAEFLSELL